MRSSSRPPSSRNRQAAAYQLTRPRLRGSTPNTTSPPQVSPATRCQSDPGGASATPRQPTARQSWSWVGPNTLARTVDRRPSAAISAGHPCSLPSSKRTTTRSERSSTPVHARPVWTEPAGSASSRSACSSPRCTPIVGPPRRAVMSSMPYRTRKLPSARRRPASSHGPVSERTASPTPSRSNTASGAGHSPSPAPISLSSGARSWTSQGIPWCRRHSAVVSPPMPPPTILIGSSATSPPFLECHVHRLRRGACRHGSGHACSGWCHHSVHRGAPPPRRDPRCWGGGHAAAGGLRRWPSCASIAP